MLSYLQQESRRSRTTLVKDLESWLALPCVDYFPDELGCLELFLPRALLGIVLPDLLAFVQHEDVMTIGL